jgi:ABC-type dipeptide/oligopeptide/nickel transport system permease component
MQNTKKEYSRLIIPVVCGLLHLFIALQLRPTLTKDSNEIYSFLLGTIPSFLTVFGLYFLVSFFTKKNLLAILIGVYIGGLLQELQQANYKASDHAIVGRTFDYYDIAFLTLGAIAAFLVERWMNKK